MPPTTSCSDEEVAEVERSACPTCGSCSGMFTANSMNCLTEALGLSLPGNGSLLATHADREAAVPRSRRPPHRRPGQALLRSKTMPRRCRAIMAIKAFENAMSAGHRHGRLHQHHPAPAGHRPRGRGATSPWPTSTALAAACPACAKWRRPRQKYHMEDVHRAGGVMTHPGRAGPRAANCTPMCPPCTRTPWAKPRWSNGTSPTHGQRSRTCLLQSRTRRRAHHRSLSAKAAAGRAWILDRENGCIRCVGARLSQEGGLAVLFGNIAESGCVVKTAGVDDCILHL